MSVIHTSYFMYLWFAMQYIKHRFSAVCDAYLLGSKVNPPKNPITLHQITGATTQNVFFFPPLQYFDLFQQQRSDWFSAASGRRLHKLWLSSQMFNLSMKTSTVAQEARLSPGRVTEVERAIFQKLPSERKTSPRGCWSGAVY